ncbi:MAG: sensor histidine kinase [Betaproteobacteria bacterium]|nr:sensor histidine kinase [Betaproteobacteria bacterium]
MPARARSRTEERRFGGGRALREVPILLSSQPADDVQKRVAAIALAATVLVFLLVVPFAHRPLTRHPLFIPVYQPLVVFCDLMTAVLLLSQFATGNARPILVLAGGYLFSALMALFHLLSFPGLFSETGLLGAGPQTTAWLYFLWRVGFVVATLAYTFAPDHRPGSPPRIRGRPTSAMAFTCLAAAAAAVGLLVLATRGHGVLPPIVHGNDDLPAKLPVAWTALLIALAGLAAIARRRPLSVLDLWLTVVLGSWACDVALSAVFNAGRFSLGWYAGRAYGIVASSILLVVLVFENTKLYRRLAESYVSERRQRALVERRTRELDELNRSLEHRISLRTSQIEASNRRLADEVAERQRAEGALRSAQEEVRQLAMLGETAREQEKSRVARELHDELDQSLYALKVELKWLEDHCPDQDHHAKSIMSSMREVLDATMIATRRIAADLRPLILDELGFAAAIESLAQNFEHYHGIACTLEMDPAAFDLDEPYSTTVFRILQESLTNIARHSGASKAEVRLTRTQDQVRLHVHDDGGGFDTTQAVGAASFGLAGLRERVHLIAGTVSIASEPGHGTTIDVTIPIPAASHPPSPERDPSPVPE